MKQGILLNDHNRAILREWGITDEELTVPYWTQRLMSDPVQCTRILNSPRGSQDPQLRITRKARRMMKNYIRVRLGLPRPSGDIRRQREYYQRAKSLGLILKGEK